MKSGNPIDEFHDLEYKFNSIDPASGTDGSGYVHFILKNIQAGQLEAFKSAFNPQHQKSKSPQELTFSLIEKQVTNYEPKTQKAAGFVLLQDILVRGTGNGNFSIPRGYIVHNLTSATYVATRFVGDVKELFLRPCPIVPRHGFVESIVLNIDGLNIENTTEKIYDYLLVARAEDPEAELIVMPYIKAAYSAVWTPGKVSIGLGNDGVTSGTGKSNTIPIPHSDIYVPWYRKAGIKDGEVPFIEYVMKQKYSSGHVWRGVRIYPVQFRGGPKLPDTSNGSFIPFDVTRVREWIFADQYADLISYEKAIKAVAGKKDVVVVAPGYSLCSHHAVHAILHNIPFYSGSMNDVNLPLKKNIESTETFDRVAFRDGIVNGLCISLKSTQEFNDLCYYAIFAMHCSTVWNKAEDAYALGIAAAMILRFSASAILGEYRHKSARFKRMGGRDNVYKNAIHNYLRYRKDLGVALDSFAGRNWGNAFGGRNWATCAAHVLDFDFAIISLLRGDDRENDSNRIIQIAHRIINASHNGGRLLTKFVSSGIMDNLAYGDASAYVQGALYRLHFTDALEVNAREAFLLGKTITNISPIRSSAMKFWNDGEWIEIKKEDRDKDIFTQLEKTIGLKFKAIGYQRGNNQVRIEYAPNVWTPKNLPIGSAINNKIVVRSIDVSLDEKKNKSLLGGARVLLSGSSDACAHHIKTKLTDDGMLHFYNKDELIESIRVR